MRCPQSEIIQEEMTMRRFYTGVTAHPKLIFICFGIAFVICMCCQQFISVNYDMNDYLPSDSASTKAIDTMEEEFDGGIPNMRVMVKDVTIPEALEYKEKIAAADGVTDILWLDDSEDVTQPLDSMDSDTVEQYYRDKSALFTVTVSADKRIEACEAVREIIGDDNAMSGSAVMTAAATESTVKEIPVIALFGILFAVLVLFLTTTSWAEPVIIMIGLGIAVIINAGSNIIFGEISFVTNAAGKILQLAVSLDYSVFLLHRFVEYRREMPDVKEAMISALCSSTSSILSSGLTTVIGFLALCVMRFRIGPDLGLALAKGIAISLLTVFILMPVLILSAYKWIDRTQHRSFMPPFHKFGRAVCRIMVPAVCIFVLAAVPSFMASSSNDFYYGASHIFGADTQSGRDVKQIEKTFGKSDTYVLMVKKGSLSAEKELSEKLRNLPQVRSIVSYADSVGVEVPEQYLDSSTLSELSSDNYDRMIISVEADYEGEDTCSLVEKIRKTAEDEFPGEWLLAGEGVSTYDLKDTVTNDNTKVNLIAIGAVFAVLLLAMKSISLPFILVLCIEGAVWINLAIPYFTGSSVFYVAYLIISSIQLGATVDYAILFTDRYMGFRKTCGRKESIVNTVSAVTVSVMTSASVLMVVGFVMGAVSSHGLLAQLGMFLGKGTLCSLIAVLFVLPGTLYIFDGVIRKTTRGAEFSDAASQPENVCGRDREVIPDMTAETDTAQK